MKMENLVKQKTEDFEFLFLEKLLFVLTKLFLFLLRFNDISQLVARLDVSIFFFNFFLPLIRISGMYDLRIMFCLFF